MSIPAGLMAVKLQINLQVAAKTALRIGPDRVAENFLSMKVQEQHSLGYQKYF